MENLLSDREFAQFQRFIFDRAGIALAASKKALVSSRLAKRLRHYRMQDYGSYFKLLESGSVPAEVQIAVDLLTTNETYFFREAQHFEPLRRLAVERRSRVQPFRVWSAASSTGEEAYSIAMVLAHCMDGAPWEVVGTDISTRVLERARSGHYPMSRAKHVPLHLLHRYCLKGIEEQEGSILVQRELRAHVSFSHANLNEPLPQLGQFDAIFLRNVLIYFNNDTKASVIARVVAPLKPGGLFFVGHSESLNGLYDGLKSLGAAAYVKP